jgi:BirA family transcriptional regulator, biotin operon repressor / biotin---[acetyl-CoA-carboxylase] ligase
MSFDYSVFKQHLTTQWIGHPLYNFDSLDSTNTHLWKLLEEGAQPGTAVLALQQKSGRGQWGRTWVSQPGGLYLSVAVAPQIPADESAQLTLCTALGVAQAFQSLQIPVGLKWPNDLLLQGKKLGGILTETAIRQGRIDQAVIGIGINWCNPIPDHSISLFEYGAEQNTSCIQSLEQLTAIALQGIEAGYERWQRLGIEALLPDYLHLLWAINQDSQTVFLSSTLTLQFKGLSHSTENDL